MVFSAGAVLALRAWALPVLAGAPAPRVPSVPAAAWAAFLRVEACALPLWSAGAAVDAAGAAVLRKAATAELQRALAARAQAAALGLWAAEAGIRLVVLKGGRAAVDGGPRVGMADLDLLVPSEALEAVAAHLERDLGFAPPPSLPGEGDGHHLRPRVASGALPVEAHRRLKELPDTPAILARALPLNAPGLRGLAPADHLLHLLLHTVTSHPDRKGRLRELVLLAAAWKECGPSDRSVVRSAVQAASVAAQLAMAEAMAAGCSPADPFRAEAAARALLPRAYGGRGLPRRVSRATADATFALLAGGADRERYWESAGAGVALPVRLWRLVRLGVGMALAAPVARAARRSAEER